MTAFDWPAIGGIRPEWTGHGFRLGQESCAVLDYHAHDSGWSENLTLFHEEVAGDGQHPIDVASRRRARHALRRYVRTTPESATLLEVGCSSGFLLRELAAEWPRSLVIGSDYIAGPLHRLATQLATLPLLRFDLVECPLPSDSLDAVVLLNVLEHIEDHDAAMAQVTRVLKPGGVAYVEVPAGPHLFDAYDRYLQHFRRYRLGELCGLVAGTGLRVVDRSHLGFLVYPAFVVAKRRNQRALHAPERVQREVVERSINRSGATPLLRWTTALEQRLAAWVRYPVGIRCVVTAVKPTNG